MSKKKKEKKRKPQSGEESLKTWREDRQLVLKFNLRVMVVAPWLKGLKRRKVPHTGGVSSSKSPPLPPNWTPSQHSFFYSFLNTGTKCNPNPRFNISHLKPNSHQKQNTKKRLFNLSINRLRRVQSLQTVFTLQSGLHSMGGLKGKENEGESCM